MDWPAIAAAIGSATRQPFKITSRFATGGGCINQSYRICGQDGRQFFVKLNEARYLPMFIAEAAGLAEIAATNTIRVPQPITHGVSGEQSFLVLEYFELRHRGNQRLLGKQLARLHRIQAEKFGWHQDNFIGTTPQSNDWADNWPEFWRERRLRFQLDLAARNRRGDRLQSLGERLLEILPAVFAGHRPQASLLHGDLWGGNHGFLPDGTPVIFDHALYYGDRECDLAMTELFGGFTSEFHAAYNAEYPLDAGYAVRKDLYNLYHILNHANLFGGGYIRQAEKMIQQLLAEAG